MAATTTEHIRSRVLANVGALDIVTEQVLINAVSLQPVEEKCLDPPGKIRTHLYIGSRETEGCLLALQQAGITHILQAGGELRPTHPHKFTYKHLSVGDEEDEDMVAVFRDAFAFIDDGRKSGGPSPDAHCRLR